MPLTSPLPRSKMGHFVIIKCSSAQIQDSIVDNQSKTKCSFTPMAQLVNPKMEKKRIEKKRIEKKYGQAYYSKTNFRVREMTENN